MWDMDNSDIPATLERILSILGHISMTCCYDTSNKPLCETKSQVLLTQSHSSTLAQEIITLLRTLHGLLGWNQVLNAMLMQKLTIAANLLNDPNLLNDLSNLENEHYVVSACLSIMESWDVRPRIGAIVEIDFKQGTVFRITQKGKLCVQLHNTSDVKKVTLYDLKAVAPLSFNLDRMPFNEAHMKTFALLFISKQYGSNQERKNIYGQVNMNYLRNQQTMLCSLNATRVLQKDQHKLRKVLKYHVNSLDQYQEQYASDEDPNPNLVVQKLLSIATQPSPLKPSFTLEEMQLAALNLSQYLAAEVSFEKPVLINNDKPTVLRQVSALDSR